MSLTLRAGSCEINFTQLRHQKCFGNKEKKMKVNWFHPNTPKNQVLFLSLSINIYKNRQAALQKKLFKCYH